MGTVPVTQTDVEQRLPARTTPFVVGQTDRDAVHAQLGEPWLASDELGFELFRQSGRNVGAPFMFVFWWPVPMGVAIDKTTAYVLVRYDATGRLMSEVHDFARDPSIYSDSGVGVTTGARLAAGDLRFATANPEDPGWLSADVTRRQAYLDAHAPADACVLLLACDRAACPLRVTIDEQPPIAIGDPPWEFLEALLPVPLAPGQHRVRLSRRYLIDEVEAARSFSCNAGERRFALLSLGTPQKTTWGTRWHASVDITSDEPDAFAERGLVLWGQGQWRLQPPPGR